MKNKILWKVYIIWFFRKILPLMVLQALIVGIGFKIFADKVFISQVLANAGVAANSGYFEFFKYLIEAFYKIRIIMQLAALFILGIGALILRDIVRAIMVYAGTFWKRNQN